MALVSQPAILPGAFAAGGDKNTIPATNDGLSGLASIEKGFPPITQQPLAQGGLPPQRADFNGIFNLFSQFLLYVQNGGVFAYNNGLDYQPPCLVADADSNIIYQCLQQNGPNTPAGVQALTQTAYWQQYVPDYSDIVTNVTQGDGFITVTKADGSSEQINTAAMPIGVVFYDSYLHDGCVKFNGATVQREDYPNLVALADAKSLWTSDPTNQPWLYGQGDGSTTMVLPDLRNVFIEGGDTPAKIDAGLPNITADDFRVVTSSSGKPPSGAMQGSESNTVTAGNVSLYESDFDASRSSTLYGNADTVQPPTIVLIPQVRY